MEFEGKERRKIMKCGKITETTGSVMEKCDSCKSKRIKIPKKDEEETDAN